MAVVNVPPDGRIYSLGRIVSEMHVYNTNNPPADGTRYYLTIVNVGEYPNVLIQPGHTQTYHPHGNAVYIQNNGPSRLQVLYVDQGQERTPEEAGWTVVSEKPDIHGK